MTSVCAGRTDAGVHALAQTLHCDVDAHSRLAVAPEASRAALDRLCGPELAIWRLQVVSSSFDARFSATQRRYRYRLCDAAAMSPLQRGCTWHVGLPALDVDAMQAGGQQLVGEHDFSSFCRRHGSEHLVRRLDWVVVHRPGEHWSGDDAGGEVVVEVAGKAFCHQMVRSVVGSLLHVGRGKRGPEWLAEVLAARDRHAAAQIAPPHGLALTGVDYPEFDEPTPPGSSTNKGEGSPSGQRQP